jgi:hypothetical protein
MTTTSSNLLSFLDSFYVPLWSSARLGSGLLCAAARRGPSRRKSPGSRHPDAVLRHGRPLQDDYAVRDLVAAERLVPNVEDWFGHLSQEAYRRRVATRASAEKGFLEKDGAGGLAGAGMILPRSFHSEAWPRPARGSRHGCVGQLGTSRALAPHANTPSRLLPGLGYDDCKSART